MTLFLKVPRCGAALKEIGAYRRRLAFGSKASTVVQRHMRRKGLSGHSPETLASLLTLTGLSENKNFFDVGAHVGLYAAMLGTVYRSAGIKIVAFEPTPETAAITEQIRDENHLEYLVIRKALSDQPGSVKFYLSTKGETSNSLNPSFREGARPIDIEVTTIDAFCAENKILPGVMKIDVETLEPQVIAGAMKIIEMAKPYIVCELLGQVDRPAVGKMASALAEFGYRFYKPTKRIGSEIPAERVVETIGGTRDWIFAPKALGMKADKRYAQWYNSVARCTTKTNILRKRTGAILEKVYSASTLEIA